MKSDPGDEVYCAVTGRRIGGDGNVVELRPGIRKPVPICDGVSPSDDNQAWADKMTIKADPGGMTEDEICDAVAAAELVALARRYKELGAPASGFEVKDGV